MSLLTRIWLGLLALAAMLILAFSLVWMFRPATVEEAPSPVYLLQDKAGRLALYRAEDGALLEEYEIYTRLLPEGDYLALQQGVPVSDDAQLERLLEDYGL